MVDNAPSVGIFRHSKNLIDARDKNIQQRAESFSLAGVLVVMLMLTLLPVTYSKNTI